MQENNFRKHIKLLLKEKGITQRDLAERLGCREQQVSNIINGRSVSEKTILRLADALEVSAAELMGSSMPSGLPTVFFAYHDGEGRMPKTIGELFAILEEWQPEQLEYSCISYAFRSLRERYSHNSDVLSAIDTLSLKIDIHDRPE